MNLYHAIMAAADQIEKHPASFRFNTNTVPPDDCGSPGCALGWIAHFVGWESPPVSHAFGEMSSVGHFAEECMKLPLDSSNAEMSFYGRMDRLESEDAPLPWIDNAVVAAQTLRKYAEKYHSHEKQRPTSALVADLMAKVLGEKILEAA